MDQVAIERPIVEAIVGLERCDRTHLGKKGLIFFRIIGLPSNGRKAGGLPDVASRGKFRIDKLPVGLTRMPVAEAGQLAVEAGMVDGRAAVLRERAGHLDTLSVVDG